MLPFRPGSSLRLSLAGHKTIQIIKTVRILLDSPAGDGVQHPVYRQVVQGEAAIVAAAARYLLVGKGQVGVFRTELSIYRGKPKIFEPLGLERGQRPQTLT